MGRPGMAAALVVVAADVISEGTSKFTALKIEEQSRQDWKDCLTHRIFYKLLVERIRDSHSADVDVEDLFKIASEEASADIKRASDQSAANAGFPDTTAWHWFGGILSFLWQCASAGLYYGSALYVGSGGSV
jgi:hypothetical protein